MKPRMRWYWRVAISFATGLVGSVGCYMVYGQAIESYIFAQRMARFEAYCVNYIAYIGNLVVVLGVYHWLTVPHWQRGVTFCGNCGYQLCGLSHPRCSECGRSI